jgi:hypothetical protein
LTWQELESPPDGKIPAWHSQQGISSLGKKPSGHFSLSLSFLSISRRHSIKQKRTLQHPGSLTHGKPPYALMHCKKWHTISPCRLVPKLLA